jgi:uncharacterized repeat protein (TIGR02543 family)
MYLRLLSLLVAIILIFPMPLTIQAAIEYTPGGASGTETVSLLYGQETFVTSIPVGVTGLAIELLPNGSFDLDVRLFDKDLNKYLIAYDDEGAAIDLAPISGADGAAVALNYQGMEISYSGYLGIGGNYGREKITITGETTVNLEIRVAAFANGSATVNYSYSNYVEGGSGGVTNHTVTYEVGDHGVLNGGTSETVAEGSNPAAVPMVTANSGYTFLGWSSDGGTTLLTKTEVESTTVTEAVTYTAYYTQNKYVVTYAAGAHGTLNGGSSETVIEGNSPTAVPTVTASSGYAFTGWSSDGGSTLLTKTQVESTPVTGAITYTAQYTQNTYVVTYAAGAHGTLNGGSSETVFEGNSPTAVPTVTASSGYTFTGWSSDGGSTLLAKTQVETTPVTGAITYTAHYTQNTYVVTYAAGAHGTLNGGSSETVIEGNSPTAVPTVTANSGYTFTGWSSDGGTTLLTKTEVESTSVTGAVTYTAQYTQNTYVVTYAAGAHGTLNGGSSETVIEGNSPTAVPTVTASSGYTFAGWSSDGGSTLLTKTEVESTPVTGAVTYTAQYTQNTYVVTYAAGAHGTLNGGSSETVIEGNSPTAVPTVTASNGYTFTGWSSDGGTTLLTKTQVETTPVTGAVTYTAYYTQNTYVVTYAAGAHGTLNGGSSETVIEGNSPTAVPTVTANSGYTFTGWSSDGGSTLLTKTQIESTPVTGAVTYTAQYTQNTYVVTYAAGAHGTLNGGSSETVIEGNSPTAVPTVTASSGYTFTGWSSDGGTTLLTKTEVESTPVTGAVTYTAQYTQNTYVVTYAAGAHGTLNGGSSETVIEGNSPTAVPTVTASSGYTFAGWSSDGGTTLLTKTEVETTPVTGAVTYTAQYTQNTYVVTYAAGAHGTLNGGSSETVIEGNSPTAVPTVTASSGYTFTGWSSDGGTTLLTKTEVESTPVTGAVTYTAQYTQNTYVVTYAAGAHGTLNGGSSETVIEGNSPTAVPTVTASSGYTFAGWSSDGGSTLLAKAQVESTPVTGAVTYTAYYTIVQSNGTGNFTPAEPPTSSSGVYILVNGKQEIGGTLITKQVEGQAISTIVVDPKKLEDRMSDEGRGAVIKILLNSDSDVVIGELNGEIVGKIEQNQSVIEIETSHATYTLPANQINISEIADQIGKNVALSDVKIQISVGASSSNMVKVIEDAAVKGAFSLVLPSLDFTVKAVYENTTISVTKFTAYVERTILIPEGVDPNKITTGIVVEPDGTIRHVPTKIVVDNGKYYVKVNSLTNSTYSFVWHPIEFQDVASHWAKKAVNDMGSRLVINGIGNDLFSPNQNITRAEVASIIVRGLGLKLENGLSPFSDVKGTEWYASEIQTAYSYNLISGFNDGTFRPMDNITREQAVAIIAKAMRITGLKAKLPAVSADETLSVFADADIVSKWAQASMIECLQAGIISGRNGTQLAPGAFISRAEVAVIMQKLLQISGLI